MRFAGNTTLRPYTKWALLCRILKKSVKDFAGVDGEVYLLSYTGVPGIESRWERHLLRPCRNVVGPSQPPVNRYHVPFPAIKRPERGVDHPLPSSGEVKERVELYLYFSSGLSCPF